MADQKGKLVIPEAVDAYLCQLMERSHHKQGSLIVDSSELRDRLERIEKKLGELLPKGQS